MRHRRIEIASEMGHAVQRILMRLGLVMMAMMDVRMTMMVMTLEAR